MKAELPHFYIGSSLGGQQKWYSRFTDFAMNAGGCAAITACDCAIYLEKYFGMMGFIPSTCKIFRGKIICASGKSWSSIYIRDGRASISWNFSLTALNGFCMTATLI